MKFQVRRDLNRSLKLLFDQNNITIPYPQLDVHQKSEQTVTPKKTHKASK